MEVVQIEPFQRLPEIYQIELTNRCNLQCPMCLRTTNMGRAEDMLDMKLLQLMHERGDFGGSAYVELQMAGEPTMHPQLGEVIRFLHDEVGVMAGLSTHGLLMGKKPGVISALLELEALTISIDSVDPTVYHRMRYPAQLEQLYSALDMFFVNLAGRKTEKKAVPFVELQLVHTPLVEGSGDVAALQAEMAVRGWDKYAAIRVTSDCFVEMQGRARVTGPRAGICMNPFSSVSVAHNGDVLSCCFIFDPKKDEINYYGNLYEQSLAEVWNSDRVIAMRQAHMTGALQGQCTKCYLKSPVQIHQNIVARSVRAARTGLHRLPVV